MKFGRDDSDAHLAACAKAGERGAFDVLVERNKNTIYHFIRRYVGQADDAYDVLQDCFIAAWDGLARYDATRPFLPWLRIIALNKCRDFGRRQTVRRLVLEAFFSQPASRDPVQPDFETDAEMLQAGRLTRLDRAIAALPGFLQGTSSACGCQRHFRTKISRKCWKRRQKLLKCDCAGRGRDFSTP